MVKDTDEQPDEGIHTVKSGRVPSTGASVPMKLGITTLPAGDVLSNSEDLCALLFGSFYGGFIM